MPGVGNDTPLFWRNQPGGPATIINKPESGTGKFYYVDSAAGEQASNSTGSDQAPCLTIEAAIVLAAAELSTNSTVSHTILLKEGHAQSLTAAIALSTAGIKIVALGNLGQRATLTMITNATAAFTVTGANCKIQGINFVCNIADTTEFIDVAADDLEICDCTLKEGSAVTLSMITADTTDAVGDNLYIHHNYFSQPSAGNGNQAIELAKDFRNVRIEYNRMYGDWDEACIEVPAAGNACTELQIHNNHLTNLLTGQHAIQISGTAVTGSITGNKCQTDTQAATIDKSLCFADDNRWLDFDGTNDEEAVPVNAFVSSTISIAPGLGGIDDTTTDSVHGKLGTDTEMADSSIFDMHGNQDVARGLRVSKTAAFTAGAGTGDIGTFALFTVTGAVKFAIVATCSETIVGAATLECGIAGTTAGIIAQIADATDLIAGEIWADATPTLKLDTLANSQLEFVNADGADIFLTIGAANITDGTIDFNIVWTPLNATGAIVAA